MVNWVDERTGAGKGAAFRVKKVFPDHWSLMLGEIAMYSMIICLLTGAFLTFSGRYLAETTMGHRGATSCRTARSLTDLPAIPHRDRACRRPGAPAMRPSPGIRLAHGVVPLIAPNRVSRALTGVQLDGRARDVVRLLGVREVGQALLTARTDSLAVGG